MPMPTAASTMACVQKETSGTVASEIAMISAERMKSVAMALRTFSSSKLCGSWRATPIAAS
jgi:hypothetical protein